MSDYLRELFLRKGQGTLRAPSPPENEAPENEAPVTKRLLPSVTPPPPAGQQQPYRYERERRRPGKTPEVVTNPASVGAGGWEDFDAHEAMKKRGQKRIGTGDRERAKRYDQYNEMSVGEKEYYAGRARGDMRAPSEGGRGGRSTGLPGIYGSPSGERTLGTSALNNGRSFQLRDRGTVEAINRQAQGRLAYDPREQTDGSKRDMKDLLRYREERKANAQTVAGGTDYSRAAMAEAMRNPGKRVHSGHVDDYATPATPSAPAAVTPNAVTPNTATMPRNRLRPQDPTRFDGSTGSMPSMAPVEAPVAAKPAPSKLQGLDENHVAEVAAFARGAEAGGEGAPKAPVEAPVAAKPGATEPTRPKLDRENATLERLMAPMLTGNDAKQAGVPAPLRNLTTLRNIDQSARQKGTTFDKELNTMSPAMSALRKRVNRGPLNG